MSARSILTISLVAAGVLAPAAIADAATKASRTAGYPTIAKIEPMRVSIGETLTITGKGFISGKAKNTVVFRRSGKRAIFVKADGLSSTKLSVKLPSKLAASLAQSSGGTVATRFQLRVLAKRFGKTYTALKSSPMILPERDSEVTPVAKGTEIAAAEKAATTAAALAAAAAPVARNDPPPPPADCDGDGQIDSVDVDDDNDLLSDVREAQIGTNRCLKDTDDDGMDDGWEYQSAIDLNQRSCPKAPANADATFDYPRPCEAVLPYPGDRAYPNPLYDDAGVDYDGDFLDGRHEFAAWRRQAGQDASFYALTGPKGMWYSDGKQSSIDTAPEPNSCVGGAVPPVFNGVEERPEFEIGEHTQNYPDIVDNANVANPGYEIYSLDEDGNGCLNDNERDEDGDFLTNGSEVNAQLSGGSWWAGVFEEPVFQIAYGPTDWLDADSDNDTLIDGFDDQDFDDFMNVEEQYRGPAVWSESSAMPGPTTGLWVGAFNPCLPAVESRTCPIGRPLGNPEAWRPYFKDAANPGKPRWPLYKKALYQVTYSDPNVTDDPNTPADESLRLGPLERWTGLPANEQTLPPLHPLPRP